MKATTVTTTAPNVTAADVLRTLGRCIVIIALYALQHISKGLGLAQRITLSACQWLNSRHNFTDKEDPVIMTGWQYLGMSAIVFVIGMFLSIRW